MGKTYRFDPDAGENRRGRREWKNNPFERRSAQPETITREWACKRMAEHIDFQLEELVEDQLICVCDKPEFTDMIHKYIDMAVDKYDPNHRSRRNGKTCSAVHYFTIVVDGIVNNIRKYQEKKLKTHIPISYEDQKTAKENGMISVECETLSDHCRNVKELWFKMDVATLMSMLTDEERTVLCGRLQGYTDTEIADSLHIDRMRIVKTLMKHIREKARLCGFIPRSEARVRAETASV